MIKNIIILFLIITNSVSVYYIKEHMKPTQKISTTTKTIEKEPSYFYRIKFIDGGVAEGTGVIKKEDTIHLMNKGNLSMTIPNNKIESVEKVYYKAGSSKIVVTKSILDKKYN